MGDPDLSGGDSSPARPAPEAGPAPASLPDLIRSGDADAFAGFRDAHIGMVRAYCEVACPPELVSQACQAAFLDFAGRVRAADPADQSLEAVLLAATRSGAASRFAAPAAEAGPPSGRRPAAPTPHTRVCAAMPELLAARANGELRGDDHAVTHHVAGCTLCAATEARLQAAEAAFWRTSGWLAGDAADPA